MGIPNLLSDLWAFLKALNANYGSIIQSAILVAGFIVALKQLSGLRSNSKGNVMNQIVSNNRELLALKLKSSSLLKSKRQKRIYHVLLLNHSANAFAQHDMCIVSDDWWYSMVADMKQTFSNADFRKLWKSKELRDCYPESFREFMDTTVLGSKN